MLAETHHSGTAATYYPTYDGNGNVSEYLDASGAVIAHFEYDPFGNAVVNTDTSNQFAYRFSTKPLNFATGFYYYGYRYYDPQTGRWPSRDPIEERGGVNLYGFVLNRPSALVDILGLSGNGTYACPCDRSEVNQKINEMSKSAGKMSGDDVKNVPSNIRKLGHSRGREFGGRICCDKTTKVVSATTPKPSQSGDNGWNKDPYGQFWVGQSISIDQVSPPCEGNSIEVARYHSHPSGSDRFSITDRDNSTLPLGVGTPDGDTSLLEPVPGTIETPYGDVDLPNAEFNGWGINEDGSLHPKNVVPDGEGGYTSNYKRSE